MRIEIDNIFKEGDRVYHYLYGWGTVRDMGRNFECDNLKRLLRNVFEERHLLSFTEYTMQGFSQKRPEELPKKGQICWVRDSEFQTWMIAHFMERINDLYEVTPDWDRQTASYWKYITTKNPYENV